jgi:hypothetical protein
MTPNELLFQTLHNSFPPVVIGVRNQLYRTGEEHMQIDAMWFINSSNENYEKNLH